MIKHLICSSYSQWNICYGILKCFFQADWFCNDVAKYAAILFEQGRCLWDKFFFSTPLFSLTLIIGSKNTTLLLSSFSRAKVLNRVFPMAGASSIYLTTALSILTTVGKHFDGQLSRDPHNTLSVDPEDCPRGLNGSVCQLDPVIYAWKMYSLVVVL